MENRSRVLFSRREKSLLTQWAWARSTCPGPQMVRNLFKRDGYASVSFRGIAPGQEPRITVDAPNGVYSNTDATTRADES